jgi:hypothetical protein
MKIKSPNPMGLAVLDVDGEKVGDIVDFYFDSLTNEPQWLVVEAGTLGHKSVLVPLDDVARTHEGLKTPYPKAMILEAPHNEGASIDNRTETELYGFYHLRRELPGRDRMTPAFEQERRRTADARLRSWKVWKAA